MLNWPRAMGRNEFMSWSPRVRSKTTRTLTDKKFPGNPTQSYRSREPICVTGEVTDWQGHSPERLKEMKDHLERLKAQGIEAID
ncbi:MAG: NAD(+)--rifampin ADP-ribosyltransferase [Opitutus sp.]|nr:NAD(+)--rifampin ADP-ribosyltransferase [Opitutus sp.]